MIFSLILFYLTRPRVKTYFHVGHRGDFKSIIRAKRKIVYGLVIILIMTSILVVLGFQSTGTISLKSVQTQENPREPGDMTVTAELTGGSPFGRVSASLFYATYFGEGSESGSETMQPMGINRYSAILHGSNGSEIWCVIESGNSVLGERTFQIGHVERSSRTSLAITNITQTPQTPTTQTMSITITVHVISNATITNVMFIEEFIAPSGYSGSSDSDMEKINNDTYSETIYASGTEGFDKGFSGENPQGTFVSGTTIYYRIAAKDASGNTAVQTKHITIK